MELNADYSRRALMHGQQLDWLESPMPGVERRMLERMGDEVARATTIVRYAPNSKFSAHTHSGGEEFLVLEGVFQDEHGDFPVGSYVRNPPTSSHTPGSEAGCTILVKLWQFDPEDRTHVHIKTEAAESVAILGRPGVFAVPLFRDARESVSLETWAPGVEVQLELPGGGEFFVVDGSFVEDDDELELHSWLRLPQGSRLRAVVGPSGAKVWTKTGHLPYAEPPQVAE